MEFVKWFTCLARGCEREAAWPWYVCTAHQHALALQQAMEAGVQRGRARRLSPR